jgi:hypothetical protein
MLFRLHPASARLLAARKVTPYLFRSPPNREAVARRFVFLAPYPRERKGLSVEIGGFRA